MPDKNYTYSRRAEQDLIQIYKDTALTWSEAQADKYNEILKSTVELLASRPDIGRSCDDIKEGYQRFKAEHHIIFYRKRKNDIFIVRILHERMDAVRHL